MLISIPPKIFFGGGGDRIPERKDLDLDLPRTWNASCGIFWPQILGEELLRFDPWGGMRR
jgi:hypothetical protein